MSNNENDLFNEVPYLTTEEDRGKRTLCCFVLDRSGSMGENNKMHELNTVMNDFIKEIRQDADYVGNIEVAVVAFDDVIETVQEAVLTDSIKGDIILEPRGTTKLVDAVLRGINIAEARKQEYKDKGITYTRPWVVLITDGEPDGDQDIDLLVGKIKAGSAGKHFAFIALGVEGAKMGVLDKISCSYTVDDKGKKTRIRAVSTKNISLHSFFQYLQASFRAVVSINQSNDGDSDSLDYSALPLSKEWIDDDWDDDSASSS